MATFMDVHDGFFGVSAEQLAEAHRRDLEIENEEGVHYEHAWLDSESGKVFCLATGPRARPSCASTSAPGIPRPTSTRSPPRWRRREIQIAALVAGRWHRHRPAASARSGAGGRHRGAARPG